MSKRTTIDELYQGACKICRKTTRLDLDVKDDEDAEKDVKDDDEAAQAAVIHFCKLKNVLLKLDSACILNAIVTFKN